MLLPAVLANLFDRHAYKLMCLGVALIPFKLALAYCVLIPLCLLWLARNSFRAIPHSSALKTVLIPLWFFFASMFICSLFGLTPLSSCSKLLGLLFFTLLIPMFFGLIGDAWRAPLFCLIAAQSVAALHGLMRTIFPHSLPRLFLGRVTESGQLGLTTVIAFGLILWCAADSTGDLDRDARNRFDLSRHTVEIAWGATNLVLLVIAPFAQSFAVPPAVGVMTLVIALASLAIALYRKRTELYRLFSEQFISLPILIAVIMPILSAALLINLKRGPWAGVTVGTLLLLSLYCRRYLVILFAAAVALCISLQPIRQRLIDSTDHFYISGGRAEIWQIAGELAQRYPMGIGFANSHLLGSLSDEIPDELRHFHSNFLNILAETGWTSLTLFVWWLYSLLRVSLRRPYAARLSVLRAAIGSALISWQLAGTVEYNFGDSEVVLIAYFLVGVLGSLLAREELSTSQLAATDLYRPARANGSG